MQLPSDEAAREIEVNFKQDTGKAVIEGKTVVPFQSLVTLILQRKVSALFKQWGKEPVIVNSDMLTRLASAPQESQENRSNIILISLGIGAFVGIGAFAVAQALLILIRDIQLGLREHLVIGGSIVSLGIIAFFLMRVQKAPRGEKLIETIEDLSSFLSTRK